MAVGIGYRQGEAKAAGNLGLAWADQGRHDKAIPLFERCIAISREIASPQTEATAVVDLASALRQLGGLEDAPAAQELFRANRGRISHEELASAQFHLWRATGEAGHLEEARCLIDRLVEQAPEAYRESVLKNVRLHREIMEAWAKHGGGAPRMTATSTDGRRQDVPRKGTQPQDGGEDQGRAREARLVPWRCSNITSRTPRTGDIRSKASRGLPT